MKEDILRLRLEGKTYNQIKDELGCSLSTISYYCNPVQKDKTMERQRDRRSTNIKFIQQYKQDAGCKDCLETYPYFVLHFDHLGDKKHNVSRMINRSLEEIKREIAKCDVVCGNCHAFRTHARLVSSNSSTLEFEIE